jgi:integrase
MSRRADEEPRVVGPTKVTIRGTVYWRIIHIEPRAKDPKDRKEATHYRVGDAADLDEAECERVRVEAEQDAQKLRDGIERTRTLSLEAGIVAYQQHLKDKGTVEQSYTETVRRLRLFFPDLGAAIGSIRVERAGELYDAFRERKRADGEPISVAYHRAALINARSLYKFCKKQGWVTVNPFDDVEGLGKRKSGKRKPTGNELQRWYDYVWSRLLLRDWTALGLLSAFSMSLRSKDLVIRQVRDVDMGCTQLNVHDGKTEKSNEPRVIPDKLQPFFRELIEGRDPEEPLFKTPYTEDGYHTHKWLWEGMARFCDGAGVPRFPPHGLKSASGTVLAKRGAAANDIMNHLSHEDEATTFRHYVDRRLVEGAQAEQAFKLIAGGKR